MIYEKKPYFTSFRVPWKAAAPAWGDNGKEGERNLQLKEVTMTSRIQYRSF